MTKRTSIAVSKDEYAKLRRIKEAQEAWFGRRTDWGEFLLRVASASGPSIWSTEEIGILKRQEAKQE